MLRCLAVIAGFLAACAADAPGKPIALEDYRAASVDATCRYALSCHSVASLEDCLRRAFGGLHPPLSANLIAALDAGKVFYDGMSARACVDAIAAQGCAISGNPYHPLDACNAVFTGTIHNGGICAASVAEECISQSSSLPACDQGCCPGTCVGDRSPGAGQVGDYCTDDYACRHGLYCRGAPYGLCAALLTAGAACGSPFDCADGLACRCVDGGTEYPSGTCMVLPKNGEHCDTQCGEYGMDCSPTRRICVRWALAGETCGPDVFCAPPGRCDDTSHCAGAREVALGGSCNPFVDLCSDPEAFCESLDDQGHAACVQLVPDGALCDTYRICANGACDPSTQTCDPGPVCI